MKMCLFARLLDFAMRYDKLTELRAKVVPAARGVVLEVGIGSGLNLPFYSATGVTRLIGIDPSADLLAMARKRVGGVAFPVTLVGQPADRIPLDDRSVDTVVVTWSLCSIQNPVAALEEIRRVLKPDGRFIFIEHGLSPDVRVQSWQNRLTPLWRRIAGGCHLNRKMDDLIRSAGFSIMTLEAHYVPGPRPVTYTYSGVATRA
jgi:ubiquinone/menaquinone biosynthesis C-methylase UbiE